MGESACGDLATALAALARIPPLLRPRPIRIPRRARPSPFTPREIEALRLENAARRWERLLEHPHPLVRLPAHAHAVTRDHATWAAHADAARATIAAHRSLP